MQGGADSVLPFKSGDLIKIASNLSGASIHTIDCSKISGYERLTDLNFLVRTTGTSSFRSNSGYGRAEFTYTASNGQLKIDTFGVQISGNVNVYKYDVYCYTGSIS